MRIFVRVLGFCIACFCAAMAVMALVEVLHGGDGKTPMSVEVGLVVFFGIGTYGGYAMWNAARYRSPAEMGLAPPEQKPEERVLAFAEAQAGRVTIAEVAAHCHLSIADAKVELTRMCEQGVAELQLTDAGTQVYVFPGFLGPDEKAKAKDPFLS